MKKSGLAQGIALLACVLMVGGCATTGGSIEPSAHDNLDAVVWQQTSSEYTAAAQGIYAAATMALKQMGDNPNPSGRGRAIVLDVDETVLDNVPYQGQLVLDDDRYRSETWDPWIEQRSAEATPGAVAFIQTAQSLGFHVVLITNRACLPRKDIADPCPQYEDTLANLQSVGIDTGLTTLMLRGDRPSKPCRQFLSADELETGSWSSVKTSRRECVQIDDDIVMMFGDQLGDFFEVPYGETADRIRDIALEHESQWGKNWFMLPNPTYGNWKPRSTKEKRSLIRGIN